ncbi:flagellar filament capping protein FliD [Bacillus xiamenensis]|uniref:Flagellar hook-associated protein 2 n=1 Tax=Bacillus xiamenensis TaxID=1178537 RepID=A0AAC9NC00_9BACI|nr:flagellar hook-associated protein 2 [Bacillus xiamenensis]AOZ89152.1 flagellar filament capping protein FliD [Bacillus xiamenensis]EKF34627.1 flagellar capping protein [Bacillus xiamenensis]MBG9913034.1 flagellar capping protein [Bacillus xiamenensis]MCW1835101.1 flagellar hook-associated protein 2 [Bacillus xiamenensis]MCY9575366.1 flagellar hook-associated protein 2 [Bacillus xiamenensis]
MVNRITGFSNVFDIDEIVSKLMKTEQAPLDKMTRQKQTLEWQRDSYREVNSKVKELDDLINNLNLSRPSTYGAKKVTSSNESAVTATGSTNATSGSINVTQLATASVFKSSGTSGFTPANGTFTFEVTTPDSTTPKTVTIKTTDTDTIDSIVTKLNNSQLGVTAYKGQISDGTNYVDTIALTSRTTGEGVSIKATDGDSASFLTQLGFQVDGDNKLVATTQGQKAQYEINGLKMENNNNTFTQAGITYELKGTTDKPVSLNVSTDVDAIFDKIKQFVDKYNELVEQVNGKVNEKRNRDYYPLTTEEKSAMSEKEVELWETTAKSGLLRSDSILRSGASKLRSDFYADITTSDGNKIHMTQIGITTSDKYKDGGKLVIDEPKLRKAIEEDPQKVSQMFISGSLNVDSKDQDKAQQQYKEQGIIYRVKNSLTAFTKSIQTKAGSTTMALKEYGLGKDLDSLTKRMSTFQDRLKLVEARYYTKFNAMDSAIQKLNNQSGYLSQLLGQ